MGTQSAPAIERQGVQVTTRAALLFLGFTTVTAQVVLMRELIVVFNGNEISLGLMLCAWLLWTAAGSALLGETRTHKNSAQRVALLQALLALALPLSLLAVRLSKLVLRPVPGELLGPGPMLLVSATALSAFCFVSGGLFAAGSRLYAIEAGSSLGLASGSMYLLEAFGIRSRWNPCQPRADRPPYTVSDRHSSGMDEPVRCCGGGDLLARRSELDPGLFNDCAAVLFRGRE